jgi:hypothetical protein
MKSKLEYSLHVAVSADIAQAINQAADDSGGAETVSAITRGALVSELRRRGYLSSPNHQAQMGAAA